MSESLLAPVPPAPVPGHPVRVEYLDFQNLAEHREFRFRVYGRDGSIEFRFRIAIAAFGAGRVRLQDGPDVCYQKLLRSVAAGETAGPDPIAIDDVELASYREAHTKVVKQRPQASPLPAPAVVPRRPARTRSSQPPVAPIPSLDTEPALEAGQRVSHAVFGAGVTTSTSGSHTIVCFDQDGPKTFVTSMLKLEVLSAPHMWETGPRGDNRPSRTALTAR